MLTLSRRTIVTGTALGTIALAVPMAIAGGGDNGGGGMPANKAVAAGGKTLVVAPDTNKQILSATFKTSKPEDLLIGVSLECSILTNVVIKGGPPPITEETSSARGAVRVWLELDGNIVPIQDTSAPPQNPADNGNGDDTDKVTFCDRLHERTVTDAEKDKDGIDGSRDYQETKSAHAFNWVRLNAGSGPHTLVVKADLAVDSTSGSSAQAVIGNRTLVIEPTKLANDAVIGVNGSS